MFPDLHYDNIICFTIIMFLLLYLTAVLQGDLLLKRTDDVIILSAPTSTASSTICWDSGDPGRKLTRVRATLQCQIMCSGHSMHSHRKPRRLRRVSFGRRTPVPPKLLLYTAAILAAAGLVLSTGIAVYTAITGLPGKNTYLQEGVKLVCAERVASFPGSPPHLARAQLLPDL